MMHSYSRPFVLTLFFIFLSMVGYGQYINKQFDMDSTSNIATKIYLNTDQSFVLWGEGIINGTGDNYMNFMKIDAAEQQILPRKRMNNQPFAMQTQPYYFIPFSQSSSDGIKKTDDNHYYSGITRSVEVPFWGLYTFSGLVTFNALGDTTMLKFYTDTSVYAEATTTATQLSNKNFWIAGSRNSIHGIPYQNTGFIRSVDSSGNLLWTRDYYKQSGTDETINTLEALPNGNVLVGATCLYKAYKIDYSNYNTPVTYYIELPWFMILDQNGNTVKEKYYGDSSLHYSGGGNIHTDGKGGYYHYGNLDTFISGNIMSSANLPPFIAHLDTGFNFTWVRNFGQATYGTETTTVIHNVKQLADGNYLLIGEKELSFAIPWMSKIDRTTGQPIWSNTYDVPTPNYQSDLYDAVELPNGHIVAVDDNSLKTYPNWRQEDAWMLETDGNGCAVPGCVDGLAVPKLGGAANDISIYPNPTNGALNIKAPKDGNTMLTDVQGKAIAKWSVKAGVNSFEMPVSAASGMYFAQYVSVDDELQYNTKVIYQH